MIKNLAFAAALLSLVLVGGCAKGGNGPCVNNCPQITLEGKSNGVFPVSQAPLGVPVTVTATFLYTNETAVTWSLSGTSCTGSGNPCGTLTSQTGTTVVYNPPSSIPSTPIVTVMATGQNDKSLTATLDLKIVPITTDVAPVTPGVGIGLTQMFTAVAVPDNAPQSFTWTCMAGGSACANFKQDPSISGLAYYTPISGEACGTNCVLISADSAVSPGGCNYDPKNYPCTVSETTAVPSRLNGTYGFRFSGYDASSKAVLVAGTFVANSAGTITSGFEYEISSAGTVPHSITGGSYAPSGTDPNDSNNLGTLTLSSGAYPNQFQVVLNAAGEAQIIESDGHGSGSGVAEPVSKNNGFNAGANQGFAFGLTGFDSAQNRVGYAGLLPTDGISTVTGGEMDTNDNGNSGNICGSSPCAIAGTYSYSPTTNTGQLTLTSAVTQNFDFFVANGQAKSGANNNNPLNLFLISTDSVDATHPAVAGTMTFQDPQTYNNGVFSDYSVSALTGANANVSLTLGLTDGKGGFTGQFDQNNAGTVLSYPTGVQTDFSYTYSADSKNNGRYTFQFLGNPGASPVVPPIPFILYASGANRGYLIECGSPACSNTDTSVITGTMNPQKSPPKSIGGIVASAITGTYAVATNSNSSATIAPLTMNLLLTSPGSLAYNIAGVENPGAQAVTGKYAVNPSTVGTFKLTAPGTINYVFYPVDLTDYFIIETDSGVSSSILWVSQ